MINPGEFRHRVTFNLITEFQQSDYGDFSAPSTTAAERFCRVKWLPGSEDVNSDVVSLIKHIEIAIRYDEFTNTLDRIDTITYNSETFYIKSIEFKGVGNQQITIIKAHTASD